MMMVAGLSEFSTAERRALKWVLSSTVSNLLHIFRATLVLIDPSTWRRPLHMGIPCSSWGSDQDPCASTWCEMKWQSFSCFCYPRMGAEVEGIQSLLEGTHRKANHFSYWVLQSQHSSCFVIFTYQGVHFPVGKNSSFLLFILVDLFLPLSSGLCLEGTGSLGWLLIRMLTLPCLKVVMWIMCWPLVLAGITHIFAQ